MSRKRTRVFLLGVLHFLSASLLSILKDRRRSHVTANFESLEKTFRLKRRRELTKNARTKRKRTFVAEHWRENMSSSSSRALASTSSSHGLGKTTSFSSKSLRRISRRRRVSSSFDDTSSATTKKNNDSNDTKTKTRGSRRATKTAAAAASGGAATAKASKSSSLKKRDNEWILQAREACVSSESSSESWVERMRSSASKQLSESKTPTNRDESWRFFDVSEITNATLVREDDSSEADVEEDMKAFLADVPEGAKVVAFVNGRFSEKWSSIDEDDKNGVSISRTISGDIASAIGTYDEDEEVEGQGAIFARINKSCARSDNVACITVKSENVENIVYIIHARRSSKDRKDGELATGANARVFIDALAKSSVSVVEKYATVGGSGKKHDSRYWANDVVEIHLAENARVFHSLSQDHGREAVHTRATYVRQNESSMYEINEVNVGAKLHRHDLRVKQLGKKTDTKLNCFNLAGSKQTQDLHSAIILDFEEGTTDQRHRCIVSSSSGKGVFDGSVRVNKLAQRTDAKQITRNLLLVPKATVNARPNLQIIADDVKCTHGCTVSDLEEEELFYIQSRGLTKEIARSLLVSGFGTEIISGMKGGEKFKEYVRETVKSALSKDAVELLVA